MGWWGRAVWNSGGGLSGPELHPGPTPFASFPGHETANIARFLPYVPKTCGLPDLDRSLVIAAGDDPRRERGLSSHRRISIPLQYGPGTPGLYDGRRSPGQYPIKTVRYKGRGFVQLTGRAIPPPGGELGIDLEAARTRPSPLKSPPRCWQSSRQSAVGCAKRSPRRDLAGAQDRQ